MFQSSKVSGHDKESTGDLLYESQKIEGTILLALGGNNCIQYIA